MRKSKFDSIKVFSASHYGERQRLDQRVTEWLLEHPKRVVEIRVLQSSDKEFHCLSFVLFYRV